MIEVAVGSFPSARLTQNVLERVSLENDLNAGSKPEFSISLRGAIEVHGVNGLTTLRIRSLLFELSRQLATAFVLIGDEFQLCALYRQ